MLTAATAILVASFVLTIIKFLLTREDADRVITIDIFSFQLIALSVLLAFTDENALPLQFA